MAFNMKNRSLLSLVHHTPRELHFLLDLSRDLKRAKYTGTEEPHLKGKNIALIFEKTSTRTRCAFEVAAHDQGAHVTYIDPVSSQIGHKESMKDTARVLGRMFDAIEYRGFEQAIVEELAKYAGVPVFNGLSGEQADAELREQFIAVLGHDLRTPLSAIVTGADVLTLLNLPPNAVRIVERMRRSAMRISGLVDDVVDFTRGRMGGGIAVELKPEANLQPAFEQVIAELRGAHPEREIAVEFTMQGALLADAGRLAQLLSNLLKNALVHGDVASPIRRHHRSKPS